jgi:glycosyltransferase involved in cell wall biosynthesis
LNTNILVSVVFSVYNAQKYLDESIKSILSQTYTNFEFIIIDDGSTDNSLMIIKKYMKLDNRIVVISRKNKGLPFSLNEGIEKSSGKYIVRMDADDISLPNRFERQIDYMEKNENVGVCGTAIESFGDNIKARKKFLPELDNELKTRLLFSTAFAHPTAIIRKSILDKNNITYKEGYKFAQDYRLWVDLSSHTAFANIQEVLLKYRVTVDSNSKLAESRDRKEERYLVVKSIFSKVLDGFGVENLEKEDRLHYAITEGVRNSESKIDIKSLDRYLWKIIRANDVCDHFDKKYLKTYLARIFMVTTYTQMKNMRFQILQILLSKFLYIFLWDKVR